MHNVSAHQLPQYYQPQQVPSTARTASVIWYMCCKLPHTKILKNFWFSLVNAYEEKSILFVCMQLMFHSWCYLSDLLSQTMPRPPIRLY